MKRRFSLPIFLGIFLILCGLCAALVFQLRLHRGTEQIQRTVDELNEVLPERTMGISGMYFTNDMPILEISGVEYAAMLEIPSFDIALPVANNWDRKKTYSAPARYFGSVYDDSLIIGGADFPRQFGFCDQIGHGASVAVTDMTGARFLYTVTGIDRAKHAENQWLMDAESDLTLFCRDRLSMEYIAVRCVSASQ